jgi:hypothetical protein
MLVHDAPETLCGAARELAIELSARAREAEAQIGFIDANTRAIFGRSYVGEPDALVKELAADDAIAAACRARTWAGQRQPTKRPVAPAAGRALPARG